MADFLVDLWIDIENQNSLNSFEAPYLQDMQNISQESSDLEQTAEQTIDLASFGLENMEEYNIKKLFIEWHWAKIKLSEEVHDELIERLNIPIEKWHAFNRTKEILSKYPEYAKILNRYR